jgi:hypothetical protein
MIQATLTRIGFFPHATFGQLLVDEGFMACTVERGWLGNTPFISCVPTGAYEIRRRRRSKFGPVYELQNVPGRSAILIHRGNVAEEFAGCIGLGSAFGVVNDRWGVTASGKTVAAFMAHMAERAALLSIVNHPGIPSPDAPV